MKRSKKIYTTLLILSIILISHLAQAQNIIQTQKVLEEEKPILFGGGLLLGGGSNSFQLGLNPELLKSYNKYILFKRKNRKFYWNKKIQFRYQNS